MDTILGILGSTTLLLNGELDDTWGKPKERALLATLAVHAGRVVPLDTLLRWAWPDDASTPANPGPTFHTYTTRIRRALERLPSPPRLRAGQGGYRLEIDRSRIDLHRFRAFMAQAREHVEHRPRKVVQLVENALALWRGIPLADLSSEPAQSWRAALLQNEWLAAHTTLVSALIDLRRFDDAIARLDELHDHPNDVNLANLRLSALYGRRRFPEGLSFYLASWRRFRADGDEHSILHLRRHHSELVDQHNSPDVPQLINTPRRLPHDVVDFVGRKEELAALDSASTGRNGEVTSGVLILDGPGGVGKTALAIHWAHQVRQRFPDGDLYVDLYGFSERAALDTATAVDEFLVALGQPLDPTLGRRARAQLLNSLLADRRMLVVLDNARDTDQVQELVSLLSSCLVIVTSRQRLSRLRKVTGARRVPVMPMPDRDAAELLAVQLGTRGELPNEHRSRLVRLCGGMPLFITVLAEDLASRSPTQVAEFAAGLNRRRLVARVGDLGDGVTPGETCFEWSYRALGEDERRLFRLLALQPSPDIALDSACACDGRTSEATARSLAVLAGAHLLGYSDIDRYRRHDLIAVFATHCLERDEPAAARHSAQRRLFDYYVAAATQACRAVYPGYLLPPNQQVENRYVTAFPNAEGALQWLHRERTTLTAAIQRAHDLSFHDHVWRLTDPVATYFDRSGCNAESMGIRELAVRSARAINEREGEASALLCLSINHVALGDQSAARQCLQAALRMVEDEGLERGEAAVLHQLGRLAMSRGDTAEALALLDRGMAVAERINDREGVTWFHCSIGRGLRLAGRYQNAIDHLHQARWHAQQIGERSAEASSLVELGSVHRKLGDLSAATGHCEQALAISAGIPDMAAVARICESLCEISHERGKFAQAVEYGSRAVEVFRNTRNYPGQAGVMEKLADALHQGGEWEKAVTTWRQSADLYDYVGAQSDAVRLRAKIHNVSLTQERTVPLARRPGQA